MMPPGRKSDLVPRTAPDAMGFFRYGTDHYIPGTKASAVGKNADNTDYPVGSKDYNELKSEMLTQLNAVNPNIRFSDSFQVYGLDTRVTKFAAASFIGDFLNPVATIATVAEFGVYFWLAREKSIYLYHRSVGSENQFHRAGVYHPHPDRHERRPGNLCQRLYPLE